jgi:deoxyguanosine kinase
MKYKHVAIEGNIGSGKTTVSKMLAERMEARLILEQFADNPFLPTFYEDREKWAFPLEMSFLAERYTQTHDQLPTPDLFGTAVISDYMIWKSLVFARINLKPMEFDLYQRFFDLMFSAFPRPELVVYMNRDLSDLQRQIAMRGRAYEQGMDSDYLRNVEQSYMEFFAQLVHTPVIILNVTGVDFTSQPLALEQLESLIDSPHKPGVSIRELNLV